jgi:fructose-bisphosphate aldolase, class II
MPLESYTTLLNNARKNNYAIGAFNIFTLEFLPAILQAAEEEKSPALLQINPVHYIHHDIPHYLDYVKSQIAKTKVPIGLNLDHGISTNIILQGIQAGFPSVMFDGSKLPFKENLSKTKSIVKMCQACNVTVEAELGTLNDEGVEITDHNRDQLFTDPNKSEEFVSETKVNALAVAIGNAHGFYKGTPALDFKRLEIIAHKVDVPLVLHGGSGISDDDFKKAISLGISKINIYTEMSAAASTCVKAKTAQQQNPLDYPTLLSKARLAVKDIVVNKMRTFSSSGKAW